MNNIKVCLKTFLFLTNHYNDVGPELSAQTHVDNMVSGGEQEKRTSWK